MATVEELQKQLAGVTIAVQGQYKKGQPVPQGYDSPQLQLVADLFDRCIKAERENERLSVALEKQGVMPEVVDAVRTLLGMKPGTRETKVVDKKFAQSFLRKWVWSSRAAMKQFVVNRNWEVDFRHENGNYANVCSVCNEHFLGHKRRTICRKCALEQPLEE